MRTPLVLEVLRQPTVIKSYSPADLDLLVRQARAANILATLHAQLEECNLLNDIPAYAREHFTWANTLSKRQSQAVRWEITQIKKALESSGVPIILLKGAAYSIAKLPCANGRLFSDIDILVPKEKLDIVEAALMLHGWATTHHDPYDQRYYRTWMHELPPMQHIKRMTVIDVHHAIVPETAPIFPNPKMLIESACNLEFDKDLQVLCPVDMVLHSAVHLFHDGELDNGLRDLLDLHALLKHFGTSPEFWNELTERAKQLELTRPLFYALRYTAKLLHTPIQHEAISDADIGRPHPLLLRLMDSLFLRGLLPHHPSCSDHLTSFANKLLYIRANWLRMPLSLLARHLFHKAFVSPKPE